MAGMKLCLLQERLSGDAGDITRFERALTDIGMEIHRASRIFQIQRNTRYNMLPVNRKIDIRATDQNRNVK